MGAIRRRLNCDTHQKSNISTVGLYLCRETAKRNGFALQGDFARCDGRRGLCALDPHNFF